MLSGDVAEGGFAPEHTLPVPLRVMLWRQWTKLTGRHSRINRRTVAMAAVYANMHPQEELAALFSRNLSLNPVPQPAPAPAPAPASAPQSAPSQAPQEERKIVYVSQHYTHSAHVARQQAQQTRTPSEPHQSEYADVERVLSEHGVDPSGLSSAQLQLFRRVEDPQKLRLIELWRFSPPTNSDDNPTLAWSMTTVDQEEALARMRYERRQQQQEQEQQYHRGSSGGGDDDETIMSLDGTPLTPIQAGDGRWIATVAHHYTEPYMVSGYEEMARREYEESTRSAFYADALPAPKSPPAFNPAHADPVYKTTNVGVDWRREAAMADQYGRLMAMREDEEML